MKKIILSIFIFLITFASVIYIKLTYFPEPTKLNIFENMNIIYSGTRGNGVATIEDNTITYKGNNQDVIDFINSISYTITPNSNLDNFDEIVVEVDISKEELKALNIELHPTSKRFQVHGLKEPEKIMLSPDTSKDIEKDEDGIPKSWNLSEKDKQAYLEYKKQLSENNNHEIGTKDVGFEWQQGTGKEAKEPAEFLVKDCLNNASFAYKLALEYGRTSNQLFQIRPIIYDGTPAGYKCIFKLQIE